MCKLQNSLAGLLPALKLGGIASAVALLVACSAEQRAPIFAKRCGHSKANILGTWSTPVMLTVTKNGPPTPSGDWHVSLWLPGFHIDRKGRCRFSCASDVPMSMVLAARKSATFVLVADMSRGSSSSSRSRRLQLGQATLTAPGASPLRQTRTKEIARGIPPYRVRHGIHEYLFSFPPIQPTWKQLELRVPIKGTDTSLLVRFTRKAPAPE